MFSSAFEEVPFSPAPSYPYECTIHTMRMHDEDGHPYNVLFDLIRTGPNPRWNIHSDSYCLRAAVVDAESGQLLVSKFVVAPRDEFARSIGDMHLMDAAGRIAFTSADLRFEMTVKLAAALLPQTIEKAGRAVQDRLVAMHHHDPEAEGADPRHPVPVQLMATDYPRTHPAGFLEAKVAVRDRPLRLTPRDGLGTMSHHFGSSLAEFGFVVTVPQPGKPSLIFVLARTGVSLSVGNSELRPFFRFGYIIRTNKAGHSTMLPLLPAASALPDDRIELGNRALGVHIDAEKVVEIGSVRLNDGALFARTWFGKATLRQPALLDGLGLSHSESFADALIDLSGVFLEQSEAHS